MNWTVVYDFTKDWFDWSDWVFPMSGLPFMFIGFFIARGGDRLRGGLVAAVGAISSASFTIETLNLYQTLSHAYHDQRYKVAEGAVEEFKTPRCGGKGGESFKVGGVGFYYSDGYVQMGFGRTQCSGGPIRSGSYVRLWYVEMPSGKRHIIRLEIRR